MMLDTTFKIGGLKRVLGGLILGALILFTPFFVSAIYPFTDDFDLYPTDSNLGDYWTYCNTDRIRIRDTECYEGKCASTVEDGGFTCWNEGIPVWQDGHWSWWNYLDKIGTDRGELLWRIQLTDTNNKVVFYIYHATAYGETTINLYGKVEGEPVWEPITTNLQADVWFKLDCEWKDLGNEDLWLRYIRCRFNEEDWSNWINPISDDQIGNVETLKIEYWFHNDRIDNIGEKICEIGTCVYCETEGICREAGCFWYYDPDFYVLFGRGGYCGEPYEPTPEECGEFHKCQFCMTQENCELQDTCEWKDYGWGFGCFIQRAIVPPEQIEWETCEYENCEELGLPEKWICMLKNMVLGIFCPSQETLSDFYWTIQNFKIKFPFNYLMVLNSFFTDVKDSLDEEKEIPVKILGQESNVDFSFWDKTTTIGGVSETFKNILFDFTSFIILMAFFVWLISFIKRFFP